MMNPTTTTMNNPTMESFQSTQQSINSTKLPSHPEEDIDDEYLSDINNTNNCFCFGSLPCFGQKHRNVENAHLLHQQGDGGGVTQGPSYLQEKVKEMKEWTEVVAGPKWKNLLRKLGAQLKGNKRRSGTPYDSFTYALNFDDGMREEQDEAAGHERFVRGFSARYAAFPGTTTSSSSAAAAARI